MVRRRKLTAMKNREELITYLQKRDPSRIFTRTSPDADLWRLFGDGANQINSALENGAELVYQRARAVNFAALCQGENIEVLLDTAQTN
jgi:hypothetical protein